MTLPISRNTTYTPASPVKSADLNDLQDCIVGNKHGVRTLTVLGDAFNPDGGTFAGFGSTGRNVWTFAGPPNDRVSAWVPLHAGDRILTVTWFFNKAGAAALMIFDVDTKNNTTVTNRDSLADASAGAAQISVPRAIGYTLAVGDGARLRVQGTNALHRFSHAIVSYDHP